MGVAGTLSTISKKLINPANVDYAMDFLQKMWMYTSLQAKCFAIVVIGSDKLQFKHWCLDDYGNYLNLFSKLREYLEKLLPNAASRGEHVYYQVLPLSIKPEKGRGTARDVKVGGWLYCDLDYKQVVDKPEFTGCREGDDYSLECYYEESGKWVKVTRPPLSQVLQQVKERLGVEPTLVVDSGAGYHLYFKLLYEIDSAKLNRLESKLVDALGGDPKSKDLARILRLPGSVNPRVGRLVQVVYNEPSNAVDPEELEQRLQQLATVAVAKSTNITINAITKGTTPTTPTSADTLHHASASAKAGQLRELSDTEVLKIVELLKEAYKPGYRQMLLLYLSGWLAKAKISPLSAVKIAKSLYESTGDTDPLKNRLCAVVYSYKKAGVDIDSYGAEIEQLAGVKPYGLEKEIQEDKVKGKSGLQEILEQTLGEERALAILSELQELLGVLSPWRDSIIELLDYSKQLYAVANLKRLIIARAQKKEGKLTYRERVAVAAPTKVAVYVNPLGGIRKYQVQFEGYTLDKPLVLGPALIESIAERLRAEGLVYHSRLLLDTLSAILQAFIRKGKAEIRSEIESPGFYLVDNKVVAVRYEVKEPDKARLQQALQLLDELAGKWFSHAVDKYSTVIKWGAVAPFSYVIKQRGRWIRWLYLYGKSDTGKTTLGKLVLRIWGLGGDSEKGGGSIDTEAKLGHVLSSTTFPTLVNEPGGALSKEHIVEMVKNAADGLIARSKHVGGSYIDYPALAPIIFTSNRYLPRDDALLKRLLVIHFSYGEKIPPEKQVEFKKQVEPRLPVLAEIGRCISWLLATGQVDLGVLDQEPLLAGEQLLAKCYEHAGLQAPQWLKQQYSEKESSEEYIVEEFVEQFKKLVHDLFARYVSRIIEVDGVNWTQVTPDSYDLGRRIKTLLIKNMIPGVRAKGDEVIITQQLLRELEMEEEISLKSLAELLGWEYKPTRLGDRVVKAAATTVDKLVQLLAGEEPEPETGDSDDSGDSEEPDSIEV